MAAARRPQVHIAKMSQYRRKRYGVDELPAQILRDERPPVNQRGGEKDMVNMMARIYKKRGWDKYAKFESKGGLNQPYILFKAKNMDPSVRRMKWTKVRPIAPGTKHPMSRLLHYVGRAWSFVTARLLGEHFVINKTSEVPAFLKEAQKLSSHGELGMQIFDIEGCFPNMPKETIRFALRDVVQRIRREKKHDGVFVPKYSDKRPCTWKGDTRPSKRKTSQKIPFEVMLDVMEFSLDFAMVRMPDGRILRQREGIPMGDPLSPGMTIGTCAWMENEWMQTIDRESKQYFMIRRIMDDICIAYARDDAKWDSQRFIRDMGASECYQAPLKLEAGTDGTFLETRFWIEGPSIRHKLKNDNEGGREKVWRYQHWESNTPFLQKRATLTACLRKVQQQASDKARLGASTLDKLAEFRRLRYPTSVLYRKRARSSVPVPGKARGSRSGTYSNTPKTVQRPVTETIDSATNL